MKHDYSVGNHSGLTDVSPALCVACHRDLDLLAALAPCPSARSSPVDMSVALARPQTLQLGCKTRCVPHDLKMADNFVGLIQSPKVCSLAARSIGRTTDQTAVNIKAADMQQGTSGSAGKGCRSASRGAMSM